MIKYLLTILCSSKLDLLKLCFESANNQINFTDYDIYIVINTLDEIFYNQVIQHFKNHTYNKLKKIIRTDSNGKPGKGHNSLLEIFKRETNYEYLLILDGDDFYYPCAIERINQIKNKTNFDVCLLYGNTKIIKNTNISNNNNKSYDINTNYFFDEICKINKISSDYNNVLATPCRLISLNREIFKLYNKLYDEDMKTYDDYYTFLLIYNLYKNNDFNELDYIKIANINDTNIYLYNTFNDNSVSKNDCLEHDLNISIKLKNELNIDNLHCEKINIYSNLIDNLNNDKILEHFYKSIIQNTLRFNIDLNISNNNNNNCRKKIIFFDLTNWTYNDFKKKSLGGTQKAIYYTSEYLSNSYDVTVITSSNQEFIVNNNYRYKPNDIKIVEELKPDMLIIQGMMNRDIANYKINNKNVKTILWMHHDINVNVIIENFQTICNLNLIDHYIFVSKWQRNRFMQRYKLRYSKCDVIQNGIQDSLHVLNAPLDINLKKKEIIYVSSPYRGLKVAFNLFQEIKKTIPDIKFKIFSCFNRDISKFTKYKYDPYTIENFEILLLHPNNNNYKDFFYELVKDKNIEFYGSVPQDVLFEHLKSAMILFYPNTYPETCCTSVLECMAYKCNIITSDLGALPETTNGFATLFNPLIKDVLDEEYKIEFAVKNPIDYNQVSDNYKKKFIDYTINTINNYYSEENQLHLQEQFNYVKNNCKWSKKCESFIEIIENVL